MTIGQAIQLNRKRIGLTQKELAEKIGVATITLQQYERNLRQPKIDMVARIADALNMDFSSLVDDVDFIVTGEGENLLTNPKDSDKAFNIYVEAKRLTEQQNREGIGELLEEAYQELTKLWDSRILAVYRPLSDRSKEKAMSFCRGLLAAEQPDEENNPDPEAPKQE